jgi:hypothetical protein
MVWKEGGRVGDMAAAENLQGTRIV